MGEKNRKGKGERTVITEKQKRKKIVQALRKFQWAAKLSCSSLGKNADDVSQELRMRETIERILTTSKFLDSSA